MKPSTPYTEPVQVGLPYREAQWAEWQALITRRRAQCDAERAAWFHPDTASPRAWAASLGRYRGAFRAMLGWPLEPSPVDLGIPSAKITPVGDDPLGRIYRMEIEVLEGLTCYGLYFLPPGEGPFPLVISQHGGGGTPELCSSLVGDSANYNDMTRRVWRRSCAVFAPQMLLWTEQRGPKYDRQAIDRELKQAGSSITAMEVFKLERSLDYLLTRPELDSQRVGMLGLSYGGFYTLYATAAETRIGVALSSCSFNDRWRYNFPDWTWFNQGGRLMDAEVAGLICPRPLFIEVGREDKSFSPEGAICEAAKVSAWYDALGIPEQFRFNVFDGVHELDLCPEAVNWFCSHLGV